MTRNHTALSESSTPEPVFARLHVCPPDTLFPCKRQPESQKETFVLLKVPLRFILLYIPILFLGVALLHHLSSPLTWLEAVLSCRFPHPLFWAASPFFYPPFCAAVAIFMSSLTFSPQCLCLTMHTADSNGMLAWQTWKLKCPQTHTHTHTFQTHQSSVHASVWLADSVASICGNNETVKQPIKVNHTQAEPDSRILCSRSITY